MRWTYKRPDLETAYGLDQAHLDRYGVMLGGIRMPDLPGLEDKLRARYGAKLLVMGYDDPADHEPVRWNWTKYGGCLTGQDVLACLDPHEVLGLMLQTFVANDFDKTIEDDPVWTPAWKVGNVLYKAMISHPPADQWPVLVGILRGLRAFSFGPGFDVVLDWACYFNEAGHGAYCHGTWYDGPLALVVCREGQPVLSVSLGYRDGHILIHQVQLRQKRGNRWLYKLGRPLLDHTLDCLEAAFGPQGFGLALVTGESAVAGVERVYSDKAEFHNKGASDRIRNLYDANLTGRSRAGEIEFQDKLFRILVRS